MGLRSFITSMFSSGVKAVSDARVGAVTGSIKDVSGTAKDVTGIRKDLVDTKLTQYKIEEHESQIQKATLDDVMRYDDRARKISLLGEVRKLPRKSKGLDRTGLWFVLLAIAAVTHYLSGPDVRAIIELVVVVLIFLGIVDFIENRRVRAKMRPEIRR